MPLSDIGLARALRLIAGTVAIIMAVSLPLGYWLVVYNFEAGETSNDAEARAVLVTNGIKGLLQSEWVILGHFRSLGACK